jgi:hypothetical protein
VNLVPHAPGDTGGQLDRHRGLPRLHLSHAHGDRHHGQLRAAHLSGRAVGTRGQRRAVKGDRAGLVDARGVLCCAEVDLGGGQGREAAVAPALIATKAQQRRELRRLSEVHNELTAATPHHAHAIGGQIGLIEVVRSVRKGGGGTGARGGGARGDAPPPCTKPRGGAGGGKHQL